ncbi:HemK2/MTQ2 family protein methyltransferase [Streptomyces griseus]|uniref:HemK2/MTQ2 family protein methyltransferase n=1 Tax=Streptomyces TaxID=1883 RepID=UPI0029C56B17|nr:HemK2/MTQ2 family protein methyltransferase [Streptomyces sp. ID01-9D]MDX5571528.1 class I SAM-dependent methyltransferase [Streptomyces sp. ID01-9D]WSV25885.1 class I SAM-dependent methyltransferase [Streptomyces fimicarius]WTC92365.1 class I SAM-dependent methyltransferase [Streptomyces griseus]WTD72196.1 class I SAM-dependent methyltransferase [Streptomyces griseus]
MRGVRVPDDDGPTTWQAVPDPIGAAPRPGPAVRLPGVYRPQTDTLLLATAMSREGIGSGMDVLDLCTGTGTLALHAARLGARVTAVDISRRAVASARLNTVLARLPVTVRRGDLLRTLPGLTFDAVISNPPYVPAPGLVVPRYRAGRSWDAGPDGRVILDRICDDASAALRPGGLLLLVQSELSRPKETVSRLAAAGLVVSVTDRVAIPFGPVTRGRAAWLRARGLLGDRLDREELVVIRARKK